MPIRDLQSRSAATRVTEEVATGLFVPRRDLDHVFSAWLAVPEAPRFLLVTGQPGSGKTAWARALVGAAQSAVVASHFCRDNDLSTRSPLRFLESVCAQLAHHSPRFREALVVAAGRRRGVSIQVQQAIDNAAAGAHVVGVHINELHVRAENVEDLIWDLLVDPLRQVVGDIIGPWVIVVDGLDEARRYQGTLTIIGLLSGLGDLPRHVRFLLTSRHDASLEHQFPAHSTEIVDLDHRAGSRAAVREYVSAALSRPPLSDRIAPGELPAAITALSDKARTNFLFAACAVRAEQAEEGPIVRETFADLPGDLPGLYIKTLGQGLAGNATRWREEYAPIAGLLAIANEPLSERQIAVASKTQRGETRTRISELRQFLEKRQTPEGAAGWAIYHLSFAEFLLDEEAAGPFWCPAVEGHAQIVNWALGSHEAAVDWRRADPYLPRHIVHHLLAAGEALDILPGLAAAVAPDFVDVRLAQPFGVGRLGMDLRLVAEALERLDAEGRPGLWPLRLRVALTRAALRSRVWQESANSGADSDEVLQRASEQPPRKALKLLLEALRKRSEEEGSAQRELVRAAAAAARTLGEVTALLDVAEFAPERLRAGLLDEAIALARARKKQTARVVDLLRVAMSEVSLRDALEREALEMLDAIVVENPDRALLTIAASFWGWSESRRAGLLQLLLHVLPAVNDATLDRNGELPSLLEATGPPQAVADATLDDLARRTDAARDVAIFQRFWGLRRVLPRLAARASPERLVLLPTIALAFGSDDQPSDRLIGWLKIPGLQRIPLSLWPKVLNMVAAETNLLDRRNALVLLTDMLPNSLLDAAFDVARGIGDERDEDRLDAELALLTRLPSEARRRFAAERLVSFGSPGDPLEFRAEYRQQVAGLLEAISTDWQAPDGPWLLSGPGARFCLDWLARTSGASDHRPQGDAPAVESPTDVEAAHGQALALESAGSTDTDDEWAPTELEGDEDDSALGATPLEATATLETAVFAGITALARTVPGAARTSIVDVARGTAVTAADPMERWERLIAVLELEGGPAEGETVRALLEACDELEGSVETPVLLASRFAELCLITGNQRFEETAFEHAARMDVRETAYGSFTGDEVAQPLFRAAVLLALAAAAVSRRASLDRFLLGAVRDLLFVGGDRLHRMSALGACADLLGTCALMDAIHLTANSDASTSACAEFLVCVAPRLDEEGVQSALSIASMLPADLDRSWALDRLRKRAAVLRSLAQENFRLAEFTLQKDFAPKSASDKSLTRSSPLRRAIRWVSSVAGASRRELAMADPVTPASTLACVEKDERSPADIIQMVHTGLEATIEEAGMDGPVRRLQNSVFSVLVRELGIARGSAPSGENRARAPEGSTWPTEGLQRLCETQSTADLIGLLMELATLADELADVPGGELTVLANHIVACSNLASVTGPAKATRSGQY